jgi:exopolyphosphatase/guanosine-5'-triphosphate,3'-diphosphate pyrophosphatase
VISGVMGKAMEHYPNCEIVDISGFPAFYDEVVSADLEKRLAMTTIPSERAKLIPTALVLINVIFEKVKINQMLVSAYAMKEGILWEMANG